MGSPRAYLTSSAHSVCPAFSELLSSCSRSDAECFTCASVRNRWYWEMEHDAHFAGKKTKDRSSLLRVDKAKGDSDVSSLEPHSVAVLGGSAPVRGPR